MWVGLALGSGLIGGIPHLIHQGIQLLWLCCLLPEEEHDGEPMKANWTILNLSWVRDKTRVRRRTKNLVYLLTQYPEIPGTHSRTPRHATAFVYIPVGKSQPNPCGH